MLYAIIPFLLKISLTMVTFVSFSIILIIFFIKPQKYVVMWTIGLGLFFISSIFLECVIIGYNSEYMSFFQRLANTISSFLIAEGCMKLLNRKMRKDIIIVFSSIIVLSVLSLVNLIPAGFYLIPYFSFLFLINLYVSIEFFMSNNSAISTKYLIGATFLLICFFDFLNYFLIKYPIYHIVYFVLVSLLMLAAFTYSFLMFHKQNESKLYEKEVCFDDTFNNSGIGMALVSPDGFFIHVNRSFSEITGYTEEELKNKNFADITFTDDLDGEYEAYEDLLSNKSKFFQREKRYVHKNGSIICAIINISLIRDKKGRPLYYEAQIQDITCHIILQQELKKSNEKYRTLLSVYNNPIAIIDNEDTIVVANQYIVNKFNELMGKDFNINTIIGQKLKDLFPGIEEMEITKAYKSVMLSRIPKSLTTSFINPMGEKVWYEFRIFPSSEGVLIISANVTEDVKIQKNLIENELKYRSLVEQSLDGIMLIDKNGKVIEYNREMEGITGFGRDGVIGKPVWGIYNMLHHSKSGESNDAFREMVENQFLMDVLNCRSEIETFQMARKDGRKVYIQHFFYPINAGDNRIICCVCRDVTEVKKLEEIKAKAAESEKLLKEAIEMERLRTEFFANLSHELRTPLNVILMANKMVFDNIKNENCLNKENLIKYLNAAKLNSYRLERLINNILELSKIDSGYLKLNPKCCNIVEEVEEITQLAVKYAENKKIKIIFDTNVEEKLIMCDTNKVERIMLNLLSNAIKYTGDGGNVKVDLYDMNEYIQIIVCDDGIGIPQEKLQQIFDGFRQVDKSLTRGQEGCGIGLALVKSIVDLHNGEIEVTSEVGKGTCIKVKLPTGDIDAYNEAAISTDIFEDKEEKVNLEFSDIYF